VTVRFTAQGCKVETSFEILAPDSKWREHETVTLSVDPASRLSLSVEENAGQNIQDVRDKWREVPERARSRVRATKYGFELMEERR
jgi:hypothetical protein